MCVFRFKIWWMMQRIGTSGKDVSFETQFLFVEANGGDGVGDCAVYTVFLPILDGDYRAVLQGSQNYDLEICLESGDHGAQRFEGSHMVFIAAGSNPFDVITNAVMCTLCQLCFCMLSTLSVIPSAQVVGRPHSELDRRETLTDILSSRFKEDGRLSELVWLVCMGCVLWDVTADEATIREKGGTASKFVIVDDGWKSVDMDPMSNESKADNTAKWERGPQGRGSSKGIAPYCYLSKDQNAVKYVFVRHAITGYWGGVKPGVDEMQHYESKLSFPVSSIVVESDKPCTALQCLTTNGIGLLNLGKVFSFYDDLHSYLASAGIDGVKVDILETLGAVTVEE